MRLDYDPRVSARLLTAMESRARRFGLDLATVELLGQDRRIAQRFLGAKDAADAQAFVARLDRGTLEARRQSRSLAADVGGPAAFRFL